MLDFPFALLRVGHHQNGKLDDNGSFSQPNEGTSENSTQYALPPSLPTPEANASISNRSSRPFHVQAPASTAPLTSHNLPIVSGIYHLLETVSYRGQRAEARVRLVASMCYHSVVLIRLRWLYESRVEDCVLCLQGNQWLSVVFRELSEWGLELQPAFTLGYFPRC